MPEIGSIKHTRSVRMKLKDLLIVQTILDEVDNLSDKEKRTKQRIDTMVLKVKASIGDKGSKNGKAAGHRAV